MQLLEEQLRENKKEGALLFVLAAAHLKHAQVSGVYIYIPEKGGDESREFPISRPKQSQGGGSTPSPFRLCFASGHHRPPPPASPPMVHPPPGRSPGVQPPPRQVPWPAQSLCFLRIQHALVLRGCGLLLGGALRPPQPPPHHEICTSSPTPAPATKSHFKVNPLRQNTFSPTNQAPGGGFPTSPFSFRRGGRGGPPPGRFGGGGRWFTPPQRFVEDKTGGTIRKPASVRRHRGVKSREHWSSVKRSKGVGVGCPC